VASKHSSANDIIASAAWAGWRAGAAVSGTSACICVRVCVYLCVCAFEVGACWLRCHGWTVRVVVRTIVIRRSTLTSASTVPSEVRGCSPESAVDCTISASQQPR